MADVVVAEHFDRAEDFLASLRPSDPRWSANPGSWVYRGHAD